MKPSAFLFLAFLFAFLLVCPAFAAIVSVPAAKAETYTGASPASTCSGGSVGNRTNNLDGSGCPGNFTLFFDLHDLQGTQITNFRVKHSFAIPSGGVGWSGSAFSCGANIYGLAEIGSTYDRQANQGAAIVNTNTSTGAGVYGLATDMIVNNSRLDFNYTLNMSANIMIVTFAANSSCFTYMQDNKGTSAFGKNWGYFEFDTLNQTANLSTQVWDAGYGILNHTVIYGKYTFAGCSNDTTYYTCTMAAAMPNGTIVMVSTPENTTCIAGQKYVTWGHYLDRPDEGNLSMPAEIPTGLYQVVTLCDVNGNASLGSFTSPPAWVDTTYTAPITTTTAGVAGIAPLPVGSPGASIFNFFLVDHIDTSIGMLIAILFFIIPTALGAPIVGLVLGLLALVTTLVITLPVGTIVFFVILLFVLIILGLFGLRGG